MSRKPLTNQSCLPLLLRSTCLQLQTFATLFLRSENVSPVGLVKFSELMEWKLCAETDQTVSESIFTSSNISKCTSLTQVSLEGAIIVLQLNFLLCPDGSCKGETRSTLSETSRKFHSKSLLLELTNNRPTNKQTNKHKQTQSGDTKIVFNKKQKLKLDDDNFSKDEF